MNEIDRMSEKQLATLRRRIYRTFSKAKAEMQAELTDFLRDFKELDERKREQLESGKITKEDYRIWLRNQVFQSTVMQEKVNALSKTCAEASSRAYKLARDSQYDVFAFGANTTYYDIETKTQQEVNLTLYNTESVKRLLKSNPRLVPNKRIKSESTRTYDARKFNAYALQGILQGKGVYDIATQALEGMADTERHWAMNNAITALTSAQNAGALQQMQNAEKLGIKMAKRWNATLDYHTRPTHRALDGEEVPLDEPFEVQGYKIMYPGDPDAAPEMVYHCRCKLTSVPLKYRNKDGQRRDNITGEVIPDQTYEEWYNGKQAVEIFKDIRGSGNGTGTNGETIHKLLKIIDPKDTALIEKLTDEFCERYASSLVENMLVITRDGEVHFMTDNNPTRVDCSHLNDKMKGSYNIHTHPKDYTQYSFSIEQDIKGAFEDGTAVMEAVDHKYRYRFEMPDNITFEEWNSVCVEVEAEVGKVMVERGLSDKDYEEDSLHVVIDETCKRLGLNCYSRRRR